MRRLVYLYVLCMTALMVGCTEDEPILFGDIYGTVTDVDTGEPIRNAEVVLSPKGASTISGSDGRFEFRSLEAGQYSISISSEGYESNSRQVTVVPGQSTSCDIHLTPRAVVEVFNIDPLTLNFGTTQTQLAVTVTNDSPNETQWSLDLGQNTWLKATPIAGQLGAGKKQTIVFSANRAYLTAETSGIVTIAAQGNTSSMTVNCSPSQQLSTAMEIMPLNIDFGTISNEQTLRIKNIGSTELNWTIFGIEEEAITVSDKSGVIQPEAAKVVVVTLDRSKIKSENFVTSFTISDGTVDQQVNVNVGINSDPAPEQPETPQHPDVAPTPRKIFYTSTNGNIVIPNAEELGANIVSNVYENGLGTITLDADIQTIGDEAFYGRNTLSTITLPSGVTEIGFQSFEGCTALASINLSDVSWIGARAFVDCLKLEKFYGKHATSDNRSVIIDNRLIKVVPAGITKFEVPQGITAIENSAFTHCISLVEIALPESVTYIGSCAFAGCAKLTKINIPSGVKELPYQMFQDCTSLANCTIPNGVTKIGGCAFLGTAITTITIPAGVTEIGWSAFALTSNLSTIHCLPTTPPTLELTADRYATFEGVAEDCKIHIPDGTYNTYTSAEGWSEFAWMIINPDTSNTISKIYYTSANGEVVTPTQTNAFGANIVSNVYEDGQGVITFDREVTIIGDRAFNGCNTITSITIPETVIRIGNAAFHGCGFTEITIPNGVTYIGDSAFRYCTSLLTVTIPNSVTTIQESAFENCRELSAFYGKFASTDNRCLIVDGVLNSFAPKGLTTYNIPNSVTKIGGYAFANRELTSITIPDSVTAIGAGAFWNCFNLTTVTIPDAVTEIGNSAFAACDNLSAFNSKFATADKRCLIVDGALIAFAPKGAASSYIVPDGVTEIRRYAFLNSQLTSITLPASVTVIEYGALNTNLIDLYCKSTTLPTLDAGALADDTSTLKIYVPTAAVNAYKAATNWSTYADKIVGYDFE